MTIVNNKMERKKIVSSIKTNIILLYFYYLIKKMWQSPIKRSQISYVWGLKNPQNQLFLAYL